MPIRRLNYTSRQRIARSDVDIVLVNPESDKASFDATVRLAAYQFPSDARVFVEAYRQTILMRFDFGMVSACVPPADRVLSDFQSTENVLFRVKVTAASGRSGMLLGEAEQLQPRKPNEEPDRRIPLLPVVPVQLASEVWRLDFVDQTSLQVNTNLRDWRQTTSSWMFRSLVYPAAMRQILERIFFIEEYFVCDDDVDWRSRWLQFAMKIPGGGSIPQSGTDKDKIDEWIENVVAGFARKFDMYAKFVADVDQ